MSLQVLLRISGWLSRPQGSTIHSHQPLCLHWGYRSCTHFYSVAKILQNSVAITSTSADAIIIGCSRLEHLKQNLDACAEGPLDDSMLMPGTARSCWVYFALQELCRLMKRCGRGTRQTVQTTSANWNSVVFCLLHSVPDWFWQSLWRYRKWLWSEKHS